MGGVGGLVVGGVGGLVVEVVGGWVGGGVVVGGAAVVGGGATPLMDNTSKIGEVLTPFLAPPEAT